ncbi:MAG: FlgD immunoglobulin-like domain containing protein, partial [bacterium]
TIDPATGAATKIGASGVDPNAAGTLTGMAFDPNSNRLFASLVNSGPGSGLDEIYEIDPGGGLATLVGKTGLGGGTDALLIIDGALYGSGTPSGQNGSSSQLIKIDMATGAGAVVGAFGFDAVHGLACSGAQSITALEYVLLAKGDIKISENRISEGRIHSNQSIHFDKGRPGTHTGAISAVGRITIDKGNTIIGDASAGEKLFLFGNATVTGVASEYAVVAPVAIPEPGYAANGAPQIAPKKGTLVLPPGTYGKVKALKRSEVYLSAGNYFVREFDTDRGAKVVIDVSAGAVNIYATDDLEFDDGVEVEIAPTGQNGTRFVSFTTLQSHKVDIGKSSLVLGSIFAPHAKVLLSRGSVFKGAIYAKSINVQKGVPFLHHDAVAVLPKTAPLPDEEVMSDQYIVSRFELMQNYPNPVNPSTVISFQLPVSSDVLLVIYSSTGRLVRTLARGEFAGGRYKAVWDGTDDAGLRVASGLYVYRIAAGDFVAQRKLLLLK